MTTNYAGQKLNYPAGNFAAVVSEGEISACAGMTTNDAGQKLNYPAGNAAAVVSEGEIPACAGMTTNDAGQKLDYPAGNAAASRFGGMTTPAVCGIMWYAVTGRRGRRLPAGCPGCSCGEVAEWLKAPVSKTGMRLWRIAGSNPALSAIACPARRFASGGRW